MKLVILSVILGISLAAQADLTQFSAFMSEHGKQYQTKAEYYMRLSIFRANIAKIEEHNRSGASWTMAVNRFSDLTQQEFEAIYTGGYKRSPGASGVPMAKAATKTRAELPDSVDWRDKGVVTPAKDQGQCGSCWAFCTTEQIESYAAINSPTNELISLSAEQVTACTPNPLHCGGTGGCYGSIPQLGYTYIQLFGHVTEEDMPYTSGHGGSSCQYDYANIQPVVGLTGYNTITPNDQDAVMQHLAEVGPLGVAVYASGWGGYGGGVYSGCKYSNNIALNHAVQLVGYGSDGGQDYWIVRNSWGTGWGENGYIRLARDSTAQCGTDSTPMDGTACVGGPGTDEQHVCGQCGVLFDCSWPLGAHEWAEP